MGGSQSSQTQTNIRNAINTEIDNYTKTINNTITNSTNEALNNLISINKTQLNASCNSGNLINMSNCIVKGGVMNIVQNFTAACVSDMMGKISTDTSWQQKFSTQLNSSFANTVKNNTAVVQAMDAKNILAKTDANKDLGGAIKNVMDTIGKSVASMTGTKITTGVITNITNEFNTKIKNKTYTKNDITNIITNINNNTVSIKNDQGCNLSASGINDLELTNCNFIDNVTTINQTASMKSLQSCTQGVISNMLSSNTGVLSALNTASANADNSNSASGNLTGDNSVTISKTSDGGLLGFLGLGGSFGKIIMIIVIICVLAGIIVVVIKVMKSSKASKLKASTLAGVPDVSNLSTTSDIVTPPANLGESNLSKMPDVKSSILGESNVIKDMKGGRGLSKMPYLKSLGFGKSGLSKML